MSAKTIIDCSTALAVMMIAGRIQGFTVMRLDTKDRVRVSMLLDGEVSIEVTFQAWMPKITEILNRTLEKHDEANNVECQGVAQEEERRDSCTESGKGSR